MKRFAVVVAAALTTACGSSPDAPTRLPDTRLAPSTFSFGVIQYPVNSATTSMFAGCLGASGDAACFSRPQLRAHGVVGAEAVGAPLNLVASVTGSTVSLSWSPPFLSIVNAYIIEAGSASGLANLANFSTGNTATTFAATGVGAGSYYVRVRAVGSAGEIGSASNEVLVVVGNTGPCAPPGAPSGLVVVSVSSGTVSLAWSPASGNPTSYVVEAGSASGLSNLANSDLAGLTPSLTASNVAAGTYYVRIRAKNACGTSGPSNEVVFTIGPSPTPTPTPTPTPNTGRLAISTTASQGWTSISVTINGQFAGTLTRYFEPGNPASCDAVAGARVVATVPAGNVSFSARSDTGVTWSNSQFVSANGCSETILTCTNRNCAPAPTPTPTPTPTPASRLYGGPSYSQFLGVLDCINCTSFDSLSISNQFGSYGSPFSSTSIWNQFSQYGSPFSTYSACNQFASQPPILVNANNALLGELTLNTFRPNAIRTASIVGWLSGVVCRH